MPGLILTPEHIWIAVEPVDMRRGIDGLSLIVQQVLGNHPVRDQRLSAIPNAYWVV